MNIILYDIEFIGNRKSFVLLLFIYTYVCSVRTLFYSSLMARSYAPEKQSYISHIKP